MANTFREMKKAWAKGLIDDLVYDSAYSDYIDNCYCTATERLAEQYPELYIEPSIQCGRGGVFASYTIDGVTYRTNWDYEGECESIGEMVDECDTEDEFINCLVGYLSSQLEDAESDEDEEDCEESEDE